MTAIMEKRQSTNVSLGNNGTVPTFVFPRPTSVSSSNACNGMLYKQNKKSKETD